MMFFLSSNYCKEISKMDFNMNIYILYIPSILKSKSIKNKGLISVKIVIVLVNNYLSHLKILMSITEKKIAIPYKNERYFLVKPIKINSFILEIM